MCTDTVLENKQLIISQYRQNTRNLIGFPGINKHVLLLVRRVTSVDKRAIKLFAQSYGKPTGYRLGRGTSNYIAYNIIVANVTHTDR